MKQYFNFSYCLILLLICAAYSGNAQNVKVGAKLDKTSILLGDQTKLHLSVHLPVKSEISFPVLADTISSKVQVVEAGVTDTVADQNNPGMHTISRTYTITSFDAGMQMIPAFVFKGKAEEFTTDALPLDVKAIAVDTTKAIYDIKQPIKVSYSFMDWLRDNWIWVAASLLGVLLLAGIWYYFKKIRKAKPVTAEAPKPAVPPHVTALEKLNSLNAKKLWQQDLVKEYHSELTDIVREYLEKRYQVKAMEQTSEEIFSGLRHLEITEGDRNLLRQILVLADLVKFAKEKPLNTENAQSMENSISFVTNTKALNQLPNKDNNEPV